MIEHVRRRVSLCKTVDEVYVATCDKEIKDVVEANGGKAIMTSPAHERCTDRIEEAATALDADIVVNVQGDEPVIVPQVVDDVVVPLQRDDKVLCSCLIYPITDLDELRNVNIVKAVLDRNNWIMYFSRSPIPYFKTRDNLKFYKQSGIMAFQKEFLHQYSRLPPTNLEKAESVDMLRVLEHGHRVLGVVTPYVTLGVDIPSDIQKVENYILQNEVQKKYYEMTVSG